MLAEGERFVNSPRWLRRLLQQIGMRRHGHAYQRHLSDVAAGHGRGGSPQAAELLDRPLHPAAVRARFGDGLSARRMTRVARCPNRAVRGAYGHRSPPPRLGQSNDPDTTYV